MALPNLFFSVASEYDGKGLGKARKDINSFEKNIKSLARTLGVTLSAAAVVNFGKASVRAFMDAEREGAILANTMRNLGLAFDSSRVTKYIDTIGRLYGVTGDQAVPALQALLSATGSVTKAQEMMNTALNIAAANNVSVAEAAKGLSQAYLGNRKALSQYNTGLTKAELQLKSFDELQQILDTRLKGAATDAAATYSGQLAILTENANQAKEAIGKGLIDSFTLLAGDNSLEVATDNMKKFGDQIAYALLGAADLLKKILDIGKASKEEGFIGADGIRRTRRPSAFEELSGYGQKVAARNTPMGAPGAISGKFPVGASYFAAQKKADDAAIKRQKELAAIEKKRLDNIKKLNAEATKKLALDKASALLNQANKLFDMDRISLAAAAMSQQTDEDRVRIRLKTNILELEDAIAEGNVQNAARFASLITQDAALLGQLRNVMISLNDVPNPFAEWVTTLQAALNELIKLANYKPPIEVQRTIIRSMLDKAAPDIAALQAQIGFNPAPINSAETTIRSMLDAAAPSIAALQDRLASMPRMAEGGVVTNPTMALIGEAGPEAVIPLNKMGSMGGDTYNIYASAIGDQQIAQIVQNAIQELNRYGNSTTYAGAL